MRTQPQSNFGAADVALAAECGMEPRHAKKLTLFVQGEYRRKPLLIIVRASNPAGLQHHGRIAEGYFPKPGWVDQKTGPSGDAAVGGRHYYSDYDLQGVWERRDQTYYRLFSGSCVDPEVHASKIADLKAREPGLAGQFTEPIGNLAPAAFDFLRELNLFVCETTNVGMWMFQHGANDGFLWNGRPVLDVKADDAFLVFEPSGTMHRTQGRAQLKAYYRNHKLSWAYRD